MATQSIQALPQASVASHGHSDEISEVVQRAHTFTNAAACMLVLLEEEQLVIHSISGGAPQPGTRMPAPDSFVAHAIQGGKLVRCNDVNNDATVDTRPFLPLRVRSLVVAPLNGSHPQKGALLLISESPSAFSNTHVAIVRTLADVAGEKLNGAESSAASPSRAAFAAALTSAPLRPVGTVGASTLVLPPAAKTANPPARNASSPAPLRATQPTPAITETPAETAEILPSAAAITPTVHPRRVEPINRRPSAPRRPSPPPVQTFHWETNHHRTRMAPVLVTTAVVMLVAAGALTAWTYRGAIHDPGPPKVVASALAVPAGALPATMPAAVALPPKPALVPVEPKIEAKPSAAISKTASAPASAPAESKTQTSVVEESSRPEAIEMAPPAPLKRNAVAPAVEAPGLGMVAGVSSLPVLPGSAARPAAPVSKATAAELLERLEPQYPPIATRMRLHGDVVLKLHLTREGTVDEVTVVKGDGVFRTSAITAVKQWRYQPAMLNGVPVESEAQVVLRFSLPKN